MRLVVPGLLLCVSLSLSAQTPRPATIGNHDSCDIALIPAATLLLPYFEVQTDVPSGMGATTLFTVVNNSRYPQIAHVTLWTDWGYPVISFNLFLTGYDVQGVNLFDVLVRAVIVPGAPSGTSITTPPGSLPSGQTTYGSGSNPLSNTSNPNFALTGTGDVRSACAGLPGSYQLDIAQSVRNALSSGVGYNPNGINCGTSRVGSDTGARAKGYITIDVVSTCTTMFPNEANGLYFAGPSAPILFDNVLSGDYQQIGPSPAGSASASTFDAGGGPLVPIHAVPEGGYSGLSGAAPVATSLPFTFYDRYTPAGARTADRRQPLPSQWNARYLQGGGGSFATDFKIWREGLTAGPTSCRNADLQRNSVIAATDLVRFDEHENSFGLGSLLIIPEAIPIIPTFPEASRISTTASVFPNLGGSDVGGWFYLNLNSGARDFRPSTLFGPCHPVLSAQRAGYGNCGDAPLGSGGSRTTSQSWVIVSMFGAVGAQRLSVDFDATSLGNGCTPAPAYGTAIGPASQRNGLVCPNSVTVGNCGPNTVAPPVNPP